MALLARVSRRRKSPPAAVDRAGRAQGRRVHALGRRWPTAGLVHADRGGTSPGHLPGGRSGMGLGACSRERRARRRELRPGPRRAWRDARRQSGHRVFAPSVAAQARSELRLHRVPRPGVRSRSPGRARRDDRRHRRWHRALVARRSRRISDLLRVELPHRGRRRLRVAGAGAGTARHGPAGRHSRLGYRAAGLRRRYGH